MVLLRRSIAVVPPPRGVDHRSGGSPPRRCACAEDAIRDVHRNRSVLTLRSSASQSRAALLNPCGRAGRRARSRWRPRRRRSPPSRHSARLSQCQSPSATPMELSLAKRPPSGLMSAPPASRAHRRGAGRCRGVAERGGLCSTPRAGWLEQDPEGTAARHAVGVVGPRARRDPWVSGRGQTHGPRPGVDGAIRARLARDPLNGTSERLLSAPRSEHASGLDGLLPHGRSRRQPMGLTAPKLLGGREMSRARAFGLHSPDHVSERTTSACD